MLTHNLALVTRTAQVPFDALPSVAAALQKQLTRDFTPIWGINATIGAFQMNAVPPGYWPIILQDDTGVDGIYGIHKTWKGKPYAFVEPGSTWSLTASHEALEMLADPTLSRMVPGPSPKPGQGRVEFLVEVCDPCQDARFAYSVNDVLVSDFVTPAYFDPVAAQVRFSFTGKVPGPRQVLPGGYLSWITEVDELFQLWADGAGKTRILDRGKVDESALNGRSVREYVESFTSRAELMLSEARLKRGLARRLLQARKAGASSAAAWEDECLRFSGRDAPPSGPSSRPDRGRS